MEDSYRSDLDHLKHIEHVSAVEVGDTIPSIPQIKELTIKYRFMSENVDRLSHLKTLKVLERAEISDLTPLKEIENITILNCGGIEDFNMFHASTQKSLYLYDCPNLKNVENFRMIRSVNIGRCENLIDVSPLYGIYDLTIMSCYSLKDISGLGSHHRLTLDHCSEIITGFESLFQVPYICLSILKLRIYLPSELPSLSLYEAVIASKISLTSPRLPRLSFVMFQSMI